MNENAQQFEKPFQTPPDLRYIPIAQLLVNPAAQRNFNQHHANKILSKYDPDMVDIVKVSERNGRFYINDGQHTVSILEQLFGEDFKVLCMVKSTADQKRDAQLFLGKNNQLTVSSMDKFLVGVTAGESIEVEINKIVEDLGMTINRTRGEGTVGAVAGLRRVYKRGGKPLLRRTLYILGEAFGAGGMEARLIDGMSQVLARYNEDIDDEALIYKLNRVPKGVTGVMGEVSALRYSTHKPVATCVAMAVVNFYNTGKGGRKLAPYAA